MDYNDVSQWAADLGSGYSRIYPLGEGGMGTLYCAHKDSLDVDVVIKRVKQKFKGRMDERAEANILKTLKHKYLPRIYDVIESQSGYVYTIMDMIPGVNMQKYVETHGPANQKLAYRWACQLCEVTAYLHSQIPPILHCDIKPSNIMITPSGDICVIDFNTSLVFSKGVLAIGATPGYAAPEQYTRPEGTHLTPDSAETVPLAETMPLRGYGNAVAYRNTASSGSNANASVTAAQATNAGGYGTISKRTDVYGIGATLYYAITGQQPGHSLKSVRPITSYKLKFSRSFLLIISRAMKKRQEERFCDAQEMLRALQNIHAIDGRYKKVVRSQKIVAAASIVLAIAGTATILLGTQRIGVERYAAYDALVRKGRTAAEEMHFDEAEQDLNQAIAIYDDQLEAYIEKAVLLYRQGKYQECIDAVETTQSRALNHDIVSRNLLIPNERAIFRAKILNRAGTVMAADLCMGTADDRVGDDHICLRTLTNDQLRIVHNCKALARVHLDQSSNCSRGRRDAAGHRGSIIIINQTSRRIPVFVIVIPVGITLCILLGMNCIADDYRGNGQDSGNYQKCDQNCSHCRNNSAPGQKVHSVFIESIFEYEEEHRQQFKHANKVCCQRHPAHGIHSGNCSCNNQNEKYSQEYPSH